ncbi:hypothetical protein HCD_07090 [Helicobacter cetorum MIT 99-5656]|uniref:Uncharacterized protein n=1 Tax=Helicobacter cetorum (strain ATCC BAA-540 / CCUG 52418 / MIT 99-5656) TaxID=1163745 RepID=I0ETZ2_HELCM|nr:hypothetical protein [Helicobacter cetorum]AFI06411.1 hypothetical protein HCD_07090 [Helicobacter cetorum MIT 99-5656]
MAYIPSKKKLKGLREQPNLFSILDDGDAINTNPYKQDNTNTTNTQITLQDFMYKRYDKLNAQEQAV